MKNGMTFTMSKSKRSVEWRNINIDGSNNYVNQINTNTCNDYNISDQCFQFYSTYKKQVI